MKSHDSYLSTCRMLLLSLSPCGVGVDSQAASRTGWLTTAPVEGVDGRKRLRYWEMTLCSCCFRYAPWDWDTLTATDKPWRYQDNLSYDKNREQNQQWPQDIGKDVSISLNIECVLDLEACWPAETKAGFLWGLRAFECARHCPAGGERGAIRAHLQCGRAVAELWWWPTGSSSAWPSSLKKIYKTSISI